MTRKTAMNQPNRHIIARGLRFASRLATDPVGAGSKLAVKLGLSRSRGVETPSLLPRSTSGGPWLTHIAYYNPNAGDVLLPVALRDLFIHEFGPIRWQGIQAHPVVTDAVTDSINRSRGLIIGGGGLFLRDTNPNPNSGWQWNCSLEALRRIQVPMALFAVGYNRFRGQPDFEPIFREHLQATTEKSIFIGLRNTGSLRAVASYLPEDLHPKLRYQPCMTTLIRHLYGSILEEEASTPPFVALNCAFDRAQLRFGQGLEERLDAIAEAMWRISRHYPIKYYSHMPADEAILPHLDRRGVAYELVSLHGLPPEEIVRAYARPTLTIGMRGHAQLIPFGCGRAVLSLVSHDKLQWFLEDIDATRWGVQIDDPDLADHLSGVALEMIDEVDQVVAHFRRQQDRLWDITRENLGILAEPLGFPRPRTLAPATVGHSISN